MSLQTWAMIFGPFAWGLVASPLITRNACMPPMLPRRQRPVDAFSGLRLTPVAVVDEPREVRAQLVVQRTSLGVLERVPVEAPEAVLLGVPRHPPDHGRRNAPPPDLGVHEQVRQVTPSLDPPDARVEHVVRDPDHPAVEPRTDSPSLTPEQPPPGPLVVVVRALGIEEGVLATDQQFPVGAI